MNTQLQMQIREQQDHELAQLIVGYLADQPRAMDTLEGIAEWWLLRQRARIAAEQVKRVLTLLTEQGILDAVGTGVDRRYCLSNRLQRHG